MPTLPFRFRRWPSPWGVLVVVTLLGAIAGPRIYRQWFREPATDNLAGTSTVGARVLLANGSCEIVRVLDGRTLIVSQGSPPVPFRVRLFGIAPLKAEAAAEAHHALSAAAPAGSAFIELDKRRSAEDSAWLAHVSVGGRLLCEAVIRAGWATYEPHSGDSFPVGRLLREAQQEARQKELGMWAK